MERIRIGGHRGSGCTDSSHARSAPSRARARRRDRPPENTLASIARAFEDGADFVEVDVMRTRDDVLVVTHSNRLAEHVGLPAPAPFVGALTHEQVRALRTGLGRHRDGIIPTLREVLDLVADRHARQGGDGFALNIEIKDVKGTDAPKHEPGRPSLVELLAGQVKAHRLPLEAVVFSSFALSDLIALARELPQARLGMLFDEDATAGQEIYPQHPEPDARYLPFTAEQVRAVAERVPLAFVHPEIHTLRPDSMRAAARLGLGVNCWAMREVSPARDRRSVVRAVRLARQQGLQLGLITDFVPEMRAQVASAL